MAKLTERVGVTFPSDLVVSLKGRAKTEGISLSELMRRATHEERLAILTK